METIYLKEDDNNTIIYLNNTYWCGYQFKNNTIQNITADSLEIFKFFSLSKKYSKIAKCGIYDVYLDQETGLKHYLYNGNEDFYLLFKNNGTFAINYLGSNHKLSKNKIFKFKNKLIVCTFLGLLLIMADTNKKEITSYMNILINDYSISDVGKKIASSPYLNEKEKAYLYNEDFISDILTLINKSFYEKNKLSQCFNNINIISYEQDENKPSRVGYYTLDTPSCLYIKNYDELSDKNKETVAHEFAHLCQDIGKYNLLTEASAEIIVQEYFSIGYKPCYKTQVKLTKKLMEIIGPEPIWYYNFTGDFSKISDSVLPYLTREEYKKFLEDLAFDYNEPNLNEPKYEELDELLNNLYYRIYNQDIKDDKTLSLMKRSDETLVRYYFNQRLINEKNSYYLDYDNGTYETLSYQEAIDMGLITAYTISYIEITNEVAFKMMEDNNYVLRRDINFYSHNITLKYSKHGGNEYIISGTIDGVIYEEANVDDLAKEGIIDVTYYIIDRKDLTSSDYENHNYKDDEINFIRDIHTKLNEDSVAIFIPQKVYLPPVNTRYDNNKQYTKKKKIT